MVRKNRIVVIDSGIKIYPEFPSEIITGCGITHDGIGKLVVSDDYEDTIGHGTAVVDQLLKETPSYDQIFCIKIFDHSMETDADKMIYALNYVLENIDCDMILMSSGVTYCEQYDKLLDVVVRLHNKGVYIVAAFDNEGSISFPAALEFVIGVGVVQNNGERPRVALNCMLDVVVQNCNYRLRWVSPSRVIVSGSSFAAPYIAAKLSDIIFQLNLASKAYEKETLLIELAQELKIPCEDCEQAEPSWKKGTEFTKKIKKAIVFPWNKEIHSLARYRDLLSFEIAGYYDAKYNLNVGSEVGKLIGTEESIGIIKNIDNLDWGDSFDTVICGHCIELSAYCKRDFLKEIRDSCQLYGKKLYAFDPEVENYGQSGKTEINYYVPGIHEADVPHLLSGRLFNRLTPVVGVFGTSSRQGKFTVQMGLRKKFIENGFHVGQIASEPSGYLLGCDAVFPFGYNINVDTNSNDSVAIVNKMVWDASDHNNKDVVIVGGQSGSVPYSYGNLSQFNFIGYDYLCGTNPDAIVLCVNPHDPVEYIVRTLKYLESFNGMPVVSIIVFPLKYEAISQIGIGYRQRRVIDDEFIAFKNSIEGETNIPVYLLGEPDTLNQVYQRIIETLS